MRFFKIDFDRFTKQGANYYYPKDELIDMQEVYYPSNQQKSLMKPSNLREMISIAQKLSTDLPFVKVDIYKASAKIYFAEVTFFPARGMGKLKPVGVDRRV